MWVFGDAQPQAAVLPADWKLPAPREKRHKKSSKMKYLVRLKT